MDIRFLFPSLLLVLLSVPAQGAVRRCIGVDGTMIYTDRQCEQLDAREAQAPTRETEGAHAEPGSRPQPVTASSLPGSAVEMPLSSYGPVDADCARNPDTLLFNLRRALENRDINALASLYHWPGMGDRSATAVMVQLERLVAHADGTADLIYPQANPEAYYGQDYYSPPSDQPTGVRVSRFQRGGAWGATVSDDSHLHIVRNAGCWWLHF